MKGHINHTARRLMKEGRINHTAQRLMKECRINHTAQRLMKEGHRNHTAQRLMKECHINHTAQTNERSHKPPDSSSSQAGVVNCICCHKLTAKRKSTYLF